MKKCLVIVGLLCYICGYILATVLHCRLKKQVSKALTYLRVCLIFLSEKNTYIVPSSRVISSIERADRLEYRVAANGEVS